MSLPNPDERPEEAPLDRYLIEIEIAAERNIMERAISLYVLGRQRFGKQRLSVMSIPTFTTYEDEGQALGSLREPTLKVSYEAAQRLLDELWRCGIRPTEEGTAGQVAAMQAHLQDMRRIVFDFIGKPPIEITGGPVPINLRGLDAFKQFQTDEERRREKADEADKAIMDREFGRRKDQ